jgi:hypothetical protein
VATEPGTMIVTRRQGGTVHVDQADPRIWISDEFVAQFTAEPGEYAGIEEGVFTVRAVNGTWVYRILGPVPGERCVEAERVSGP